LIASHCRLRAARAGVVMGGPLECFGKHFKPSVAWILAGNGRRPIQKNSASTVIREKSFIGKLLVSEAFFQHAIGPSTIIN
jgi:hypothetical protein